MASGPPTWGIEIGQCALKAVKMRAAGDDGAEIIACEVIPYDDKKILSQPEADRDALIASALKKFTDKHNPSGERFVIGVPGHQTFARFCKLPPADAKRINALVRYEAEQQIPFAMEDVVWDFQKFEDEESPEVEVGIFAMRKDLIRRHLEYFNNARIRPYMVQTSPSALYNFVRYELEGKLDDGACVVIDVGAQNTDLIVVEPNRAWSRNIPLGGSAFTENLVRAFKLTFAKAEDLKRSAASSKYARQIFQAMRPVFADLVQEIQRSIGFFSSTHREIELNRVLAVGNAFRLPGLQKYIANNLSIEGGVDKLENFRRIKVAAEVNKELIDENLMNLGPTCGLALQGLGEAKIVADLLPPDLARLAVWKRKQWWFAGAAACVGVAALIPFAKNAMDAGTVKAAPNDLGPATEAINTAQRFNTEFTAAQADIGADQQQVENVVQLLDAKRIIPAIIAVVHEAMPKPAPEIVAAKSPQALKQVISSDPNKYARNQRKQFVIEALGLEFVKDIDNHRLTMAAAPGGFGNPTRGGSEEQGDAPGFVVNVKGKLLYGVSQSDASAVISGEVSQRLRELSQQPGLGFYIPRTEPEDLSKSFISKARIYQDLSTGIPTAGNTSAGTAANVDPGTGEPTYSDWNVEFGLKLKLGELPPPPETTEDAASTDGQSG
ncbi:MAG: type IV pilus assembly protein PilM [Phycisphaerae bacterium]